MAPVLGEILTAIVTPFGTDGAVDEAAARAELERAVQTWAALPVLTQASTSDARNFQRRPTLWAGILLRVIHL